jgi:gas vesicle protein
MLIERAEENRGNDMAANKWQRITSIFLIGVGVGATVGLLFAPQSGEETRDRITGAVLDGVDGVVAQGNKLGRRAQKAVENAKGHLREAAESAEQAFHEAKNSVS